MRSVSTITIVLKKQWSCKNCKARTGGDGLSYDITQRTWSSWIHGRGVMVYWGAEKKIYSYSEEEKESFEHLSDINILLDSKGKLKNLSRGQIRTLKRRGLAVYRGRAQGFDKYTDEGLKLLKELKLI
jgi:hypothetical protein